MNYPRCAAALLVLCLPVCGAAPRGGPTGTFHTEVPAEPFNVILGRPTASSIAVSVWASSDMDGFIRYGAADKPCTNVTETVRCHAGETHVWTIGGLSPDTSYRYEFCHRVPSAADFEATEKKTFHTQRPPGATFTFTITADSHLDENTDPQIYASALRNAALDRPDFHMDLGDTFMTGKRRNRPEDALPQYLAQRYYFSLLSASAPLFLVLGNHDGESGSRSDVAQRMRTTYFANPSPDKFYSGSPSGNYYAWTWGDALFIVLDPFTNSPQPTRGAEKGGWNFTLGRPQYDWLRQVLESSKARYKFVFIHNLVGGRDSQGRGGTEAVPFFEWGGMNLDGRDEFAEKRPGWPMPIHALLVKHGVNAVFHGHDHFYDRQEVDGIIYQLVPQPGHPGEGSIGQAASYGYGSGQPLPGAGYLRVKVTSKKATVEFVRNGAGESAAPAYTIVPAR